uniref:Coiled-coil and C2 domain containing 2B n=1 Tax=Sphenodon punctatus TaxID=8508 RepID=A0A8D0L309_SPHPU
MYRTDFLLGEQQRSINDSHQNLVDLNEESLLLDDIRDVLLPDLFDMKPPEYESSDLQIKKQWEQVFVPSDSPVIHSCKLPKDMIPRILEDEGFHIPRKPEVSRKSCNKMENRLLQEGGKCWFAESGEIIALPSPIKQTRNFRKLFPIKTIREKRQLGCCFPVLCCQGELYQLSLNISTLLFSYHPLFNREHVLASRLLQLYECFQNRQQQNVTHLLSEKLEALLNATKVAESNLETSQLRRNTLENYRLQIRDTSKLYDAEQQKDISLIQNMLKVWKQIKSLRRQQEFTTDQINHQFVYLELIKFFFNLVCFRHEQKRRAKVQRQKYFIKIFYNEKQVSCTSETPLQLDFKVIIQQIFSIQVLNWPESLRIEIFESTKRTKLLTKVCLPIPNNFILKSKDVLEQAEFSCEHQVKPSDGTVGSNVPFLPDENEIGELWLLTSGRLMYSLSWAVNDRGIPLAPVFQPINATYHSVLRDVASGIATGIVWCTDVEKLIEWAKEVNIDPNDPEYSDLIELIKYARFKEQNVPKYFRLEQLQEEFNFVTEEEIKKSKRFQLLQLRNLGQLDFCHYQQIPLYDREIPDTLFQEYENQLEKEILMTDVDPITAQRISSANFMRKLVMIHLVKTKHKFNLSDIVSDYEEIISMSQLRNAVFKVGERRRHLKPQRKERRKVPAQTVSDGDVKLLVRILRAYNIPSRKSVTVHPFVEVSFQHTGYQTSIAEGSHPCWNEELQVDFTSPGHDYSFSGLSKIKDNVYINIFDEFVIEKHEDTCPKGCSGHSYIRKNWLGSVSFPFSALLEQSKICGTFQVNMPPVFLGYTWSKTYMSPQEEYCGPNLKEYTFLTIFATIEPQLSSVESDLESDKVDETLLQRAYIFKKDCKALFPRRRIITSVFNNEGRNILVTKYISALNPPEILLDKYPGDLNTTFDIISQFVSLIPCISDTLDENDDIDIWMTSEHCISLATGNKEEHAVLLCNYLLYFGKKAWVLLGTSVLEGKVAYVLTQENGYYFLWNPLNGQRYKQFDTFCPLQRVDCLINWENVWFNTQQNNSPMCVSFDISKEGFWKQLLPYNFQHTKAQTVQPKEILYSPTDENMVEELQSRLEKALKSKVMEWRSRQPTRWHRQCTAVLRQILPKLELSNGNVVMDKEEKELESLQERYWVTGYPIQMPYIDLQSISEAVYQTDIHSSEVPNTEFALAVHIHPYPNNILSVWIYLVSLVCQQ